MRYEVNAVMEETSEITLLEHLQQQQCPFNYNSCSGVPSLPKPREQCTSHADIIDSPGQYAREPTNPPGGKKSFTPLDLCVSSLRRGHANLLCIVPILTDDPRRESDMMFPHRSYKITGTVRSETILGRRGQSRGSANYITSPPSSVGRAQGP